MKNKIKLLLTVFLVSLFIMGCAKIKTIQATPTSVPDTQLANGVKIISVATNTSSKYAKGIFQIANTTDTAQNINYKVIWFNDKGETNSTKQPWIPLELYPGMNRTITATAPNPTDSSFRVVATLQKF